MPVPGQAVTSDVLWQGPFSTTATPNTTGWCSPIPLTLSAVVIAHTTTTDILQVAGYNAATAYLGVSSASGNMQVFIQQLMPDRITWIDYASFNATTTATSQVAGLVSAGNSVNTGLSLNALAVGTARTIPLGTQWRWVFQINEQGNTGPASFTLTAGITLYG